MRPINEEEARLRESLRRTHGAKHLADLPFTQLWIVAATNPHVTSEQAAAIQRIAHQPRPFGS